MPGTKDVKYHDIALAGSKFLSPGVALDNFQISAGKIITGGASFTKGSQDVPIHLSHTGQPYELEIHYAHNMNVVIYDTQDRRGWLIDGASALLHLSRTQLSSSPYSESGLFNLEDFHYADPKAGPLGAKKALLDGENRALLLFEKSKTTTEMKISIQGAVEEQVRKVTKRWMYEDLVQQTYHILEQVQDRQLQMMTTIDMPFVAREKLLGFGFMDIVDGRSILFPRVATLKNGGRGWVDFTRSIKAIALLGSGFGDMIQPAEKANKLCKYWTRVPTGKDYLVASISILEEICRQHGDRNSDVLQLTNGLYWHKPDKLFESCECKVKRGSRKAGCDRIQVLLPHSAGSRKPPTPFQCSSGAVIFGRSTRLPWRWPSKGNPSEGEDSESESEKTGRWHDSALGGSISTTVEPEGSTNREPSIPEKFLDNVMKSRDVLENEAIQSTPLMMQDQIGTKVVVDHAPTADIGTATKFEVPSRGLKRKFLDKISSQTMSRKKEKITVFAPDEAESGPSRKTVP
ncbi:hypothetical protein V8E51_015542 [Hyaloscypha variabilis]